MSHFVFRVFEVSERLARSTNRITFWFLFIKIFLLHLRLRGGLLLRRSVLNFNIGEGSISIK